MKAALFVPSKPSSLLSLLVFASLCAAKTTIYGLLAAKAVWQKFAG
jgi:hypothetical protein